MCSRTCTSVDGSGNFDGRRCACVARNGRELFYSDRSNVLMPVPIKLSAKGAGGIFFALNWFDKLKAREKQVG
jgi:hypothetical protein